MSFRTFILSLSASFGVAWLAIIIVPYIKMRSMDPIAMEEADGTNAVFIRNAPDASPTEPRFMLPTAVISATPS